MLFILLLLSQLFSLIPKYLHKYIRAFCKQDIKLFLV